MRWKARYRDIVPREWRLCRFCYAKLEDEAHALLGCHLNVDLSRCPEVFMRDARKLVPKFGHAADTLSSSELLQWMVDIDDVPFLRRFARYVYDVFGIFTEKLVYVPPAHFYK